MAKKLWEPTEEQVRNTNMYRFMTDVNATYGKTFSTYRDLWEWSVTRLDEFWSAMWTFAGIKASAAYTAVIDDPAKMPGAQWFPGARLNFAENLLRYRDERTALLFHGEDQVRRIVTYAELSRESPRHCAMPESRRATGSWGSCRTCRRPSSPCWPPRASAPPGPRAHRISASRESWTGSARFSPRSSFPPTVIISRGNRSIPWAGSPTS